MVIFYNDGVIHADAVTFAYLISTDEFFVYEAELTRSLSFDDLIEKFVTAKMPMHIMQVI